MNLLNKNIKELENRYAFSSEGIKDKIIDFPFIVSEVALRQLYWRLPQTRNKKNKSKTAPTAGVSFSKEKIIIKLKEIGIGEGSLVMLHTSMNGLGEGNRMLMADWLLKAILELIGKKGTLTMPTHPLYKEDPGFMNNKSDLLLSYFPEIQASRVGFMNELFRRTKGTKRSLHPLSSLCAYGPLADTLLEDNLNEDKPLPHGVYSSYYKFCLLNGIVISIGLPLANTMTVCHVAEELRDAEWPVKDFFYERKFKLPGLSGDKVWTVRERRPEYVRSLAKIKRHKDFVRNGIINESSIDGIRIDYAHSAKVLSFMLQRNNKSTYPFYFPELAR